MEPREANRLLSDYVQLQKVLASAEAGVTSAEAKLARARGQGEMNLTKAIAYRDEVKRQLDKAREAWRQLTPQDFEPAPETLASAETATAQAEAN